MLFLKVLIFLSLKGMVGAINAPTTGNNTLANFQKNALAFQGASGVRQKTLL
jgi:hypothetical protein